MKLDSKLVKELSLKHMVRDKTSYLDHKILWQRVIRDYKKEYPQTSPTRKQIKNCLFDTNTMKGLIGERYVDDESEDGKKYQIKSRTINDRREEVLQVYTYLNADEPKSQNYIMDLIGYDTREWIVKEFKESNWGSTDKPMFAYGIKVAPKKLGDISPREVREAFNEFELSYEPYKPFNETLEVKHELNVVQITDTHIGSKASYAEMLPKSIERAVERALENKVEKVVLAFTGDIIHADSTNEATVRGTPQKLEGSAFDMVNYAYDILEESINRASKIMPVDIYWVQGNHSRALEQSIFEGLKRIYRNVEHVNFYVEPTLRKAMLYGTTLIGLEHGDAPKRTRFQWLQYEFSEMWGKATQYEILGGHTHAENTDVEGKQIYRTARAFTGTDEWSYSQRYQMMLPRLTVYTYDKEFGYVGMRYI